MANYAGHGGMDAAQTKTEQRGGDQIAEMLYKRCAQFEQLLTRLGGVSDRLLGPRPHPVPGEKLGSDPISPGRPPFVARLGGVDSQLCGYLDEFERVLNGLESFV